MNRILKLYSNEKGIALFLVLWILALLSVIVGEFCHTIRSDVNMTWDFAQRTKAYYFAYAGMENTIAHVVSGDIGSGGNTKQFAAEEEKPEPSFRLNYDNPMRNFGEGAYRIYLGNESGKININLAGRKLLEVMLNPFNLDKDEEAIIVDSIMDWRDKDNFHRINGAEDDYYRNLPEPYECRDGYFESVQELLLVRGVSKEIFYGGLRDMVTVYVPKEVTTQKRKYRRKSTLDYNYNKINLNAAPYKVLAALPGMNEDAIDAIMEYRKEKDFTSVTELGSVVDAETYQSVAPFLTVRLSPYFTVFSTGYSENARARETLWALIEVNRQAPRGYSILQWKDHLKPAISY